MKLRQIWMVIPAVAVSLVSCKKKDEPKAPAPVGGVEEVAPATAVEKPAPVPEVVKPKAASPDERAASLGFVKYLPAQTEVVMSFHQGAKAVKRIQSSRLWRVINDDAVVPAPPAAGPVSPAAPAAAEPSDPAVAAVNPAAVDAVADASTNPAAMLLGTEFTMAMGKSTGGQAAEMLTLNRRMGYFQFRMLAKAFAEAAKKGDLSNMSEAIESQYGQELMKDLLADPESGVGLVERLKMPPLYLAFKTTEANRATAAQQLTGLIENLGMLGEMVSPVEIEKAGQKFSGQKISGAKISEQMGKERQDMEEVLEPAMVDRLLAAIAKKDLVVMTGAIGDYALLFIGASADDLQLAATASESLLGSADLAFCDDYLKKDLAAVIYGQKQALDQVVAAAGGLADMAKGMRDGLASSDGLGDTRDLEALLRMAGERESALRALGSNDAMGVAAFFEDGFKIESFGGSDSGAVDWKADNKLALLGDSPDVVMFANMTTSAAYGQKAGDYMEALFESAYAIAMKAAAIPGNDADWAKFQSAAKVFDTQFRSDAVVMWDALRGDFVAGLGAERAWVMDMNGSVPPIPGVPQDVVDKGKFPRVSIIAPVKDRAKLAASWDKINGSLTQVLAKISQLTEQELPMQKPISSEKNGLTTWFFSMPFFNDDFMPSVTVGDQWFVASSSKNQALDLVAKATQGGPARNGIYCSVNFQALQKFARTTHQVIEKNGAGILGSALDADDLKMISKMVEGMSDLDKLTVHSRRDGGVLRSSTHLKTR